MKAEILKQKRAELQTVQKQINKICKKPLSTWRGANDITKKFYLELLGKLEFQKIDLLDQIIKIND